MNVDIEACPNIQAGSKEGIRGHHLLKSVRLEKVRE